MKKGSKIRTRAELLMDAKGPHYALNEKMILGTIVPVFLLWMYSGEFHNDYMLYIILAGWVVFLNRYFNKRIDALIALLDIGKEN